jgi:hypothetical protein
MLEHMRAEAIFGPVSVLALWTGVVVLLTGVRRIRAVRARRVPRNAFRIGEASGVPEDVAVVNRNLMNLLEMPILFYVVSIALYVTHHVGQGALVLAWVYVGLRLLHSWEHLTTNHVLRRLTAFALSNFVLVALWIGFIKSVF